MALSFQTVKNSNNVLQTVFQKAGALKKKKNHWILAIYLFIFSLSNSSDCIV